MDSPTARLSAVVRRTAPIALLLVLGLPRAMAADIPSLEPEPGAAWSPCLGSDATPCTIRSAVLDEARRVHVVTPASWDATDRSYPLLVVLDGASLLPSVLAAASFLAQAGAMPEVVIAAVDNTERLRDLTPPGLSVSGSGPDGGGDRFLDFLEKELMPAMSREYRAGPPCLLVGHSSGGILATYAAASRDVLPFVLALDTPAHLGDDWLPQQLAARAIAAGAPPVRYASLEARFGWPDGPWHGLVECAPESWTLFREKLPAESHETMVLLGSYLGLRALFADYSAVRRPAQSPGHELDGYDRLAAAYGGALPPPERLLAQLLEEALVAGRPDRARHFLDRRVRAYGPPADLADLHARLAAAERLPPLEETVESMQSLPRPSPKDMARFLGDWSGEVWSDPSRRNPARLRLHAVDGAVAGEFTLTVGRGRELVQSVEYLQVHGDRVEFGYLNGMHPRGLLVYEAVLSGDSLEGEMRMRGVAFTPPPGMALPRTRFRLSRT